MTNGCLRVFSLEAFDRAVCTELGRAVFTTMEVRIYISHSVNAADFRALFVSLADKMLAPVGPFTYVPEELCKPTSIVLVR